MAFDLRIAALGCVALAVAVAAYVATERRAPATSSSAQPPPAVAPAVPGTKSRSPGETVAPVGPAPGSTRQIAKPGPTTGEPPPATHGTAGASKATNPNFTHFRVGNRNVKRILVDANLIWVATSGGLIRYDSRSDEYRLFDTRSGLRSNSIVHVGKLKDRVVVGSYGGGLSVLRADGSTWDTFGTAQGLADEFVSDALVDSLGDVWIATRSGLNRVRGGALNDRANWQAHTVESTQGGLPSNRVYALAAGRTGELWAATEGGVARFQRGAWQHWLRDDAPKKGGEPHQTGVAGNPNFTVAIAVDRVGAVWAGSMGGGLARYDGAHWTYFMRADGLPGDNVFTLHQDGKRQLWVGTDNGLARLQNGKFKVLTTQDGLLNNAVFAMASTAKALWVGGYGGVARIRAVN